jgi:hypothetical protein
MSKEALLPYDPTATRNENENVEPEEQPEQQPEEPIQMGDNIKDLNFLLGINPNYLD